MEFIRECDEKRVNKNGLRFIKTDLMFFKICTRFSRISLEDEFHIEIIALQIRYESPLPQGEG